MARLSAFADEVSDDFSTQVRFLVSEHVRYIEIRFVNKKNVMDLSRWELFEARQLMVDNGINVSAIGSPIGKVTLDVPIEKHLDRFRHAVELAHFFQAPFIRVFSYYPPQGTKIEDCRDEVITRMRMKAELLEGTDIVMVHENESEIYGHSATNCVDLVKSVNSPKLRLVYDPGNFVWGQHIDRNVDSCWPLVKPYVVHIHIKDWTLGKTDVGSIPGEGDGQIPELLRELAANRYGGFLTMEPHLKAAGRFGGETGPELFSAAIGATRSICAQVGLKCE